jgi:hypothetical protein
MPEEHPLNPKIIREPNPLENWETGGDFLLLFSSLTSKKTRGKGVVLRKEEKNCSVSGRVLGFLAHAESTKIVAFFVL